VRRPSFPSTILLLGLVFAARADDRARLLSVSAGGDADSAVIAFEGDRPLSFTTLQLQTPPRVVVDFADTSVAGVPAELSVEDGTVRRVATAEVGAGTARVVIELAADAEFDVRAKGNRLEVRVARIAPFVVSEKPVEAARPPEQVAQAQPPPAAQVPATASAQPPAGQIAQAPVQPAEAPPSEAEKRASLPTVSLVGSRPAAPPPEPKPLSAAELKKKRAAEKRLAQKRAAEEAAEAKKRVREQRVAAAKAAADRLAETKRAAAEKRATAAAERKAAANRAAAEKKAAQEARALAAAEKQKKAREVAVAEAPRRPKPPEPVEPKTLTVQEAMALREANDKGLPTGLGPPPEKPAPPRAPPEQPAHRTARAEPPRAHSESSRIAINSIGFRPVGNGEVIIRSDKPLTYGVGGDEHAVLLHLPGSAIPRPNDRRPLDTHFFDGPVLRVVPIDVPGGIDLRIELRAKAEYALSQQGAVLTVVFAAPK
jgi:hypothetical protein